MGKKIVGIAMGGFSSERKISIRSGNQVYENLDQEKWEIYKVEVNSKNCPGGGVTVVNVLQKHCDIRHARRHEILLLPHKFSFWVSPPS